MDAQTPDACELIDDFLDDLGADPSRLPAELAAHLETCETCRSALAALVTVHQRLLAAPIPEPPAHFSSRTLARLDAWHRSRPAWQPAFYQLGAIVSGVALVGAALALVRLGEAGVSSAVWVATLVAWLRVIGAVGARLVESPWMALSYPIIAVMLAAMWFLVLAGPRLLFGRGSRKAL